MASFRQLMIISIFVLTALSHFVSALDVRPVTPSSFSSLSASATSGTPPPYSPFQETLHKPASTHSIFSTVIPILTDLGLHDLAMAAHSLTVSSPAAASSWPGPVTIFAPSDSAVRTCPSCSLSLMLQEHTVPGLYSLDYLRRLIFGAKVETILPGRCLTVTHAVNGSKIFIGGIEITRPDIFNNGQLIIHGLQGFVSHLSPYSCSIDKMTSLSLPHPSPELSYMRLMLADVMVRLRTSGYSVLALALRVKSPELLPLHNMTVFALDDSAIFHGGHSYVRDVRFHIVPNRFLMLSDLEKLPASTVLQTLESGESLTVTTSGGGGILTPLRINYVRMKTPDLIHNPKIVVHGLALPFPHLHQSILATASSGGRTSSGLVDEEATGSQMFGSVGMNSEVAPSPVIESTSEIEDRHGL